MSRIMHRDIKSGVSGGNAVAPGQKTLKKPKVHLSRTVPYLKWSLVELGLEPGLLCH